MKLISRRLSALLFALALTGLGTNAASALTLPELQRQLKSGMTANVSFNESRESPWLDAPVESSGTMHSSAGVLEKRVTSPRKETWRIHPDRMEWVGPGTGKTILFSNAPAVAVLANALRLVLSADLTPLENDFTVDLDGDDRRWSVRLKPKTPGVSRYLDRLELQGEASVLEVMVIVERGGTRTTTRFQRPGQ